MGLKCLPNYVQEVMKNIFSNVKDIDVYIEDVDTFSKDWKHHI